MTLVRVCGNADVCEHLCKPMQRLLIAREGVGLCIELATNGLSFAQARRTVFRGGNILFFAAAMFLGFCKSQQEGLVFFSFTSYPGCCLRCVLHLQIVTEDRVWALRLVDNVHM